MSESTVTFKKRSVKASNVRKKSEVDGDDQHEEYDANVVQDIKFQQTMRARKTGSSIDALTKVVHNNKNVEDDNDQSKTIESVMGTQYTTQVENGLQSTVPHKKLMDQYIDDKLGLSKTTS
jgi:hypothetical protein